MLPIEILPFSANAPTVSQSRGFRSSLARVDRRRRDNTLFTIPRGRRVRLGETGESSEALTHIRLGILLYISELVSVLKLMMKRSTRYFATGWKRKIQHKLLKPLGKEIILIASFIF